MHRLILVLCALVLILPVQADDDDGYKSENNAKSLRPPRPREERRAMRRSDDKNKDKDKSDSKRETMSAEDVKKILAAKGKDMAVRGKVHEVFMPKSGSVLIMNFGSNHRECFKAVVYKRSFDKWEGGADAIKKLVEGKTVVVEGVISEYQTLPQIALSVPSQLKVEK